MNEEEKRKSKSKEGASLQESGRRPNGGSARRWLKRGVTAVAILLGFGLIMLFTAGCSSSAKGELDDEEVQPPWQGFWVGRGVIFEKVMDDPVRKLTRQSETDFWFVVDRNGQVHGEGFIGYKAELKAIKFKVPIPNAGSIEAEVEGTAPEQIFKFGISGMVTDEETNEPPTEEQWDQQRPIKLSLVAIGKDGQAEENSIIPGISFTFSIDAMVVVPAGVGGTVLPGANIDFITIPIEGKGWSPFQGLTPTAEIKPREPYRVMAQSKGDKHNILWYAIQQLANRVN